MTLLLRRSAVAFGRSPARACRHHHRRETNDHLPRNRGPLFARSSSHRGRAGAACRRRAEPRHACSHLAELRRVGRTNPITLRVRTHGVARREGRAAGLEACEPWPRAEDLVRRGYLAVGARDLGGPLLVEVADVDAEDMLELAATEDQEPIEALPKHAADPAFRVRVRVPRADRCAMTAMSSCRKMLSRPRLNVVSRSWIRKRRRWPRSSRSPDEERQLGGSEARFNRRCDQLPNDPSCGPVSNRWDVVPREIGRRSAAFERPRATSFSTFKLAWSPSHFQHEATPYDPGLWVGRMISPTTNANDREATDGRTRDQALRFSR